MATATSVTQQDHGTGCSIAIHTGAESKPRPTSPLPNIVWEKDIPGEVTLFWGGGEVSHEDMNHVMPLVFRAREWALA